MIEYHIMLSILLVINLYQIVKIRYIERVMDVALDTKHEPPVWLSRDARKQAILDHDFLRHTDVPK
jgi:hypothetical protein